MKARSDVIPSDKPNAIFTYCRSLNRAKSKDLAKDCLQINKEVI